MTESATIQHCNKRFEKARAAAERLSNALDLSEAEASWSDFLLATSGVYSKLEQGSKISGKASGWFGRKKHERKRDPLLSYVHHARNSDEHGIADVTQKMQKGSASFSFREPYDPEKLEGKSFGLGVDAKGHVRFTNFDPEVFEIRHFDKPSLLLIPVTDRGETFNPPKEHLGKMLEDKSPAGSAFETLSYLERLIYDAREVGI